MAQSSNDLKIVIFCGGGGTRIWPISRNAKPKQFQPLVGEKSTFQTMVEDLQRAFSPSAIFPITKKDYVDFIASQAPFIPHENILIEPDARDTFAAVGFAAAILNNMFVNPTIVSLWSDHTITNKDKFVEVIGIAGKLAQEESALVDIAARPTFPSTQLGYLQIGKAVRQINGMGVFQFVRQVEKPDYQRAREMLKLWDYVWHIGYKAWQAEVMLSLYQQLQPDAYQHLQAIVGERQRGDERKVLKEYSAIPKSSVDYAIYVKADKQKHLVVLADLGWSDIGAWDVLKDELSENKEGNVVSGNIEIIDLKDCLVYGLEHQKLVAAIGLEGLVIVDTPDVLLVCSKDRAQDVKKMVEKLKEEGKDKYL
ncbi:mannose-1-phosphate guanylyltransferase [Candidatus Daviesbacteria bacterium]|nr:mannose-1-phosphate guanylyltransferase [Candidatus Daviesbacteria bacterium]